MVHIYGLIYYIIRGVYHAALNFCVLILAIFAGNPSSPSLRDEPNNGCEGD